MKRCYLFLLVLSLALTACSRYKTFQKTESIMGTNVTITVVARTASDGGSAIDAGMEEVRRFDRMMSLYKEDSEVTKVNMAAGKHPVSVSPELIDAVEAAARASEITGGAFDITVGPLVVLWQMRLKDGNVPTAREIANVKNLVNYRNIIIDRKASTLFLKKPGMIMDLGGMKGYIADRVRDLFKKRGIDNALIALAGDIWAIGHREDGKPWKIGVQHPRDRDKTMSVLDLSDKYVATSGDYERFVIWEKKRYHHIIDPRTGMPSTGVISATLVGDRGEVIDPLAKAPFILGADQGIKLVKKAGAEAIVVDEQGQVFMTEGLRKMEDASHR